MPFTDSRVHGEKSCSTQSPWAPLKVAHDGLSLHLFCRALGWPSAAPPADPQNQHFPKNLLSWWAPSELICVHSPGTGLSPRAHPEWKHKWEAAESLTAQRRSTISPIVGVLLQTPILIGISWHHYLLLLSMISPQGKKFPVLYSKGSNLRVWSLSVSTHVKMGQGFSRYGREVYSIPKLQYSQASSALAHQQSKLRKAISL